MRKGICERKVTCSDLGAERVLKGPLGTGFVLRKVIAGAISADGFGFVAWTTFGLRMRTIAAAKADRFASLLILHVTKPETLEAHLSGWHISLHGIAKIEKVHVIW